MAFEAYHTATARRDGLPLPNAFGFNDVGERLGFGKTWGTVGSARPGAATAVPNAPPPTPQPVYPPYAPYAPTNQVPVGTAPDWVGYVPPTAFGGYATSQGAAAASVTAPMQAQATRDAGASSTTYAETYTGASYPYGGTCHAACFYSRGSGAADSDCSVLADRAWRVDPHCEPAAGLEADRAMVAADILRGPRGVGVPAANAVGCSAGVHPSLAGSSVGACRDARPACSVRAGHDCAHRLCTADRVRSAASAGAHGGSKPCVRATR